MTPTHTALACSRQRPRVSHVRLPVPPLAAVTSGIPVLLTRRISELAVHVLGGTVSPARPKSRFETNHVQESPDRYDHGGEEEESLPPRHLDHLDPIWTTASSFPACPVETWTRAVVTIGDLANSDANNGSRQARTRLERPTIRRRSELASPTIVDRIGWP